jgi:two-component system, NarL family, response regulator NreC
VEAIQKVKSAAPDVVLLDLTMPRMGGLEALPEIRRARPLAKVIVVTVHNSREYLRQAMAARADGYLLKDTAPAEYLEAIHSVVKGRIFVSAGVEKDSSVDLSVEAARRLGLTARELKYLSLAAQGKKRGEIGLMMGCGTAAVRSYQRRVLSKLGFKDMATLTRFALESGF